MMQAAVAKIERQLASEPFASTLNRLLDVNDRLARAAAAGSDWAYWDPDGFCDRSRVARALGDLWYGDGQDSAQSQAFPGVLAANAGLMALAAQVNSARQAYSDVVASLRGQTATDDDGRQRTLVRALLTRRGQARLNHRMAVRKILILPQMPRRIAFTYAHVDSVERISVHAARQKLLRAGLGDSDEAGALSLLAPDEPLAWLRCKPPRVRANLFFDNGCTVQRLAVLPLLVPGEGPPPEISASQRDRCPRPRRRARLEASPLLPSLNIYRYQACARALANRGDQMDLDFR